MKYKVGDRVRVKTWADVSKEFDVGFPYEVGEHIIGPDSIEGSRRESYERLGGATGLVILGGISFAGEPYYKIHFGQHVFEIFYEFELCDDNGIEYAFCEEDFLGLL